MPIQVEKLTKENIPTMWLARRQTSDFRMINDSRSKRMKDMMDGLFETMNLKLVADKLITMKNYFWMVRRSKPTPVSTLSYGKNQCYVLKKSFR